MVLRHLYELSNTTDVVGVALGWPMKGALIATQWGGGKGNWRGRRWVELDMVRRFMQ